MILIFFLSFKWRGGAKSKWCAAAVTLMRWCENVSWKNVSGVRWHKNLKVENVAVAQSKKNDARPALVWHTRTCTSFFSSNTSYYEYCTYMTQFLMLFLKSCNKHINIWYLKIQSSKFREFWIPNNSRPKNMQMFTFI